MTTQIETQIKENTDEQTRKKISEKQWIKWYRKEVIKKAKVSCSKLAAAGVNFSRSEDWAAYITLHSYDGDFMCKADLVACWLDEALIRYYKDKCIDLTTILKWACVHKERPVVELCTNDDWFNDYSIYRGSRGDGRGYHIRRDKIIQAVEKMKCILSPDEAYFVLPNEQRYTYDGWQNARFVHRNSIAGTFDVLTDIGIQKFMSI